MKVVKRVKFYAASSSPTALEGDMTFSIYKDKESLYAKVSIWRYKNDREKPYGIFVVVRDYEKLEGKLTKEGFIVERINSKEFCTFKYRSSNIDSALECLENCKILGMHECKEAERFTNGLTIAISVAELQLIKTNPYPSFEECIKKVETDMYWKLILSDSDGSITSEQFINAIMNNVAKSAENSSKEPKINDDAIPKP